MAVGHGCFSSELALDHFCEFIELVFRRVSHFDVAQFYCLGADLCNLPLHRSDGGTHKGGKARGNFPTVRQAKDVNSPTINF